MKSLFIFLLWLACGIAGAGLLNADLRKGFPNTEHYWSDEERIFTARRDCGFTIGLGVIGGPISLITIGIMTGVGAAGWSLDCKPVPRPVKGSKTSPKII